MMPAPAMTRRGADPQGLVRAGQRPASSTSGHDFPRGDDREQPGGPTPMDTIMKQVVAIGRSPRLDRARRDQGADAGHPRRRRPAGAAGERGRSSPQAIPGAELRTIRGVGHMFFWETAGGVGADRHGVLSRVPAGRNRNVSGSAGPSRASG